MARMGKKETLKLCDKLIEAGVFATVSHGQTRHFNAGYSHGLATAARLLGVSEATTWRCHDIAADFTDSEHCPAGAGAQCIPSCECHARGLPRARSDGELLYLLGFKTWEEINQEV